jgi:hypothetical protein
VKQAHPDVHLRDMSEGRWYRAQNEFIDQLGRVVGPYGIAVYHVLCRREREDVVTNLSANEIARLTDCSRSEVFRALLSLEENGAIARRSCAGRTTTYLLLDLKRPVALRMPAVVVQKRNLKQSLSDTGAVSNSDGTRLTGTPPYIEVRTQDCKTNLPPTPLTGGGSVISQSLPNDAWQCLLAQLKTELASTSLSTKLPDQYDRFFRDSWQIEFRLPNVIVLDAENPEVTRQGLQKYRKRISAIGREFFGMDISIEVAANDEFDQVDAG